jgi:aerobic-type carbon monoxide dehydrogenase small subunit (CoxS/CutS family)
VEPDTPLLWVIREAIGLPGTKFGCGMALCGACTVHLDGAPARSCVTPVSAARGKRVTTVEGLATGSRLHPVQEAWIEVDVPQCGYCQSGQIMSAAALLARQPDPTDADIDAAMSGNICRCGTYQRSGVAIARRGPMRKEADDGARALAPSRRDFLRASATLSSGILPGFRLSPSPTPLPRRGRRGDGNSRRMFFIRIERPTSSRLS